MRAGPLRLALVSWLLGSAAVQALSGACSPQLVAADRRGSPSAISRQGDVLYLGAGAAVVVIDTTDLAAPVERGRVDLDEMILDVSHWQSTVVALRRSGLTFVDAGDPDAPVVVGSFPFPPEWVVRGHVATRAALAFVAEAGGLRIVSFADPASPAEVGSFPAASTRDVAVNGSLAYLLNEGILRVLDISNPANPTQVATVPVHSDNDNYLGIAGSGNRLAAWGTWRDGHFAGSAAELFSLADPQLPVRRSSIYADDWSFQALAFAFDRLYFGYSAYDVSSLANPVEIGWIDELGWPVDLAIAPDPDRLFVATRDGLLVADLSDPSEPVVEAAVFMPSRATDGYFAGTMAVLVRERELEVLDLSDPARPDLLGRLPADERGFERIERVGDHAYVKASTQSRVEIVDLSDPAVPTQTGNVIFASRDPVFAGGIVGAVERTVFTRDMHLYDASDPGSPQHLISIPFGEGQDTPDFAMAAKRLYFWDDDYWGGDPRLRTLDLSDPSQPVEIGSAAVDPWHWGRSAVRGRYLLLADAGRFDVLDVASPSNPIRVATLPLPVSASTEVDLTVYGGIALVAPHSHSTASDERVFLVDVSDPRTPAVIGEIDPAGTGDAAFAGPGLIVIADGTAGYSIYSSCVPFADGFESGDVSEWNLVNR